MWISKFRKIGDKNGDRVSGVVTFGGRIWDNLCCDFAGREFSCRRTARGDKAVGGKMATLTNVSGGFMPSNIMEAIIFFIILYSLSYLNANKNAEEKQDFECNYGI